MTKVLLTGSTGFVGRQVLKSLRRKGASVRVVIRSGATKADVERDQALESVIETENLFRESKSWWVNSLKDIDTVVHVAWYAKPTDYIRSPENVMCLEGTLRMAQAAITAGVKRFVGVGTCFEYDLSFGTLACDTPLKPISLYAATKASTYLTLSQLLPMSGVEFTWCRLFYLFGEGEDERRFVAYVRAQLAQGRPVHLTSGTQIRDFMDVRDAGNEIATLSLGNLSGPINICTGKPISIRKMAENIADEFGRRDLLLFGARAENLVDPPYVVGLKGLQNVIQL